MDGNAQEKKISPVAHTTHIGQVTGQVHTGSGDINVGPVAFMGTAPMKEDLLSILRSFREELQNAYEQGLPENTYDDTLIEVEAAEREVQKESPKPDRIVRRLEQAKTLLTAGSGVATALATAIEKTSTLVPLIDHALQTVSKIF